MSIDEVIRNSVIDLFDDMRQTVNDENPLLVNQKVLAKKLGCSVNYLKDNYIYQDDFPVLHDKNGSIRYPLDEVKAWIHNHTTTRKEVR